MSEGRTEPRGAADPPTRVGGDVLSRLRAGCAWQLDLCERLGSPTYAALLRALIDRLGTDRRLTGLLAADPGDPIRTALCLRLFGAVTRLARTDPSAPLRAYLPTLGGRVDPAGAVPVFLDFLAANLDEVGAGLRVPVQTNEVGRAAPLSAAMNHVAAATRLPLRLLEVGASAGLNLWLDRYLVDAGDVAWGPPDSPLRLTGHFESGRPTGGALDVAERRGCDRAPLDVHDAGTGDLLRSFVWPEHVDRLRRLDAALEIAQAEPRLDIEAADAADWVARHAGDLPAGRTSVVFHSVVLPYLEPERRRRLARTIRAAGAAADEQRPLAWVCLEPTDEDSHTLLLTCQLWPGGRRVTLARSTPHGLRVRWDPREEPAARDDPDEDGPSSSDDPAAREAPA